jgi:heptosyltransferase-2
MAKLYSLGFDSAELGWFYDQILPRTWGEHELSKNAGFVQALFGTPWKPQAGWGKALFDSALESQPCISEPPGFGILHPGSRWATKRWDKYPELLEALLSNSARLSPWNRLRWVITGDSEDQNLFGGHFARFEGNPRVDVRLGRVSLREFLGLCRRASLMMTNDSFPTHVAGCFDVPCLTVFGPTVPAQGFGPSSTQSAVVERTELGCRPCGAHGHRRCPLSHFGCMKQISVDQVLSVLETLPIQGQNGTGP